MEATDIFSQEFNLTLDSANSQSMRKMERKLFETVKKGDLEKVRNTISSSRPKCNLNCVSNSGKTVLQVAGDLEDVSVRNDMITLLLKGGAELELALLHAVRESNARSVKVLLQFRGILSLEQESLSTVNPNRAKCQEYSTPLILAACLQNFQIVKLLLEHGFTICDSQTDPQLSTGVVSEKLGPAVFRLNRYPARASPVFIAASFLQNSPSGPDPIHGACILNKELSNIGEQEYEFRKEYLELSDGCNECRSTKEIRCVMETHNEGGIKPNTETEILNILEFAIVTRNEKVYKKLIEMFS